ncbi:MAG: hypothetical protein PGN13_07445 [Patulibacter minatonensis]
MPSLRSSSTLAFATLALAGCGSAGDEAACVPSPRADCRDYSSPSANGLASSVSGGEAARAAIQARECGDFIGRPVRALRLAWGAPADNAMIGMGDDSTMVWIRSDGETAMQVIADYDERRVLTDIAVNRDDGTSGETAPFCGEAAHLPRPSR